MQYYTYILAFHVVSIISWMAMLFYQPRLFTYHIEHKNKKDFTDIIEIQEQKLYKIIGFPAFVASLLSGLTLLWLNPVLLHQNWMILKLILVTLLAIYSFSLEYFRKRLASGKCTKSGQFFRAYNEVPTLLYLLIVPYVIVKSTLPVYSLIIIALFGFIIYKIATLKK
jgi:putative membrane protein